MKYPSTKPFCSISFLTIQHLLNLPPWLPMAYGDTGPLLSAFGPAQRGAKLFRKE